jgi:membrane associated rhomboid family serine protease
MPAWVMLGYWFLIQLISGAMSIGGEGGGVAFWAHAGGFIAGVLLIKFFTRSDYLEAHRRHHWKPRRLMYE